MSTGAIIQPAKFQSLRHSRREDYDLYKAALEWGLIEPIVIESRQDIRSEPQWHESLEPYKHQVSNLITFCRRLPVTLLADDVGLGKTISAGLIISELMSRGRVSKVFVVCPKLIMPQWKEELESKFKIPAITASGKDLIEASPPEGRGAVITTYTSARMYLDHVVKNGFELLILDEAHKLRNLYGVDEAPQVALKFREALQNRVFKYVLMLTATPIQNRLWDMYSLIDLLTVARGHENPFGSKGMFARRFIGDNQQDARQLKLERRDEFRSIVYSHMSRIRRGDANLYFPDRQVQLHRVKPTSAELELIKLIAEPIQTLNRLGQISVAQALVSSPHALAAQLETMARNKTVPVELARQVRAVTDGIAVTAKQAGLMALADQLRKESPEQWRMVVFTTRRETQTSIEAFLAAKGIKCGIINGDSGRANQNTVAQFRKSPPDIHVVVSTEAGSEGVNLQAANVVVNYDLPWNPMIVEQRIGRVQRLASQHAKVCVFNVMLSGTFEEYIVGRLMEKLQLASHAIGDVDSLLEAAGINEEDGEGGLEERIRTLVIASLAGKDVETSIRLAEKSITEAKATLENEKKDIDDLLGTKTSEYKGPRCPKLPPLVHSMSVQDFVSRAVAQLGGKLESVSPGTFNLSIDGKAELVRFADSESGQDTKATLLKSGEPSFERLVSRISSTGRHMIEDHDTDTAARTEKAIQNWIGSFDGKFQRLKVSQVGPCFVGTALLRVRVTVAHDSLERLVEVPCFSDHAKASSKLTLEPLPEFIFDPSILGLTIEDLLKKTVQDTSVAEFCRFYSERLIEETQAAGSNERARKKLEDEFTPRLQAELVGLEGQLFRRVDATVQFTLGTDSSYSISVSAVPSRNELTGGIELGTCNVTGRSVPQQCLGRCAVSGKTALKHLLIKSDSSGRHALDEHIVVCAATGKRLLSDEVQKSDVSGQLVDRSVLKTSSVSGKRAEPAHFGSCEVTGADVLLTELSVSQVSGKRFRLDQQERSIVSGKMGHSSEFIHCAETNQVLLPSEASRCEITGKVVKPGILESCEVTGKQVLPSELLKCAASGKKAIKKVCVTSSISGVPVIEGIALRSTTGKHCSPFEANECSWTAQRSHPEDTRQCSIANLVFHKEWIEQNGSRFAPLVGLLSGTRMKTDNQELWPTLTTLGKRIFGGANCTVEAAETSPSGTHMAVCLKVSTWLGLKVRYAGCIYSLKDGGIVGQVSVGRRENGIWTSESSNIGNAA